MSQHAFITRPDAYLAEGELDLGPAAGDADERVIAFMMQLLRQALRQGSGSPVGLRPEGQALRPGSGQEDSNDGGAPPSLSSLSVRRLSGSLEGRIYGQAYAEKRGDTVVFLRAKLFNARGQEVMRGMATSHIAQ